MMISEDRIAHEIHLLRLEIEGKTNFFVDNITLDNFMIS